MYIYTYTCTTLPEFILLVYEVYVKVMQDFYHQQYGVQDLTKTSLRALACFVFGKCPCRVLNLRASWHAGRREAVTGADLNHDTKLEYLGLDTTILLRYIIFELYSIYYGYSRNMGGHPRGPYSDSMPGLVELLVLLDLAPPLMKAIFKMVALGCWEDLQSGQILGANLGGYRLAVEAAQGILSGLGK